MRYRLISKLSFNSGPPKQFRVLLFSTAIAATCIVGSAAVLSTEPKVDGVVCALGSVPEVCAKLKAGKTDVDALPSSALLEIRAQGFFDQVVSRGARDGLLVTMRRLPLICWPGYLDGPDVAELQILGDGKGEWTAPRRVSPGECVQSDSAVLGVRIGSGSKWQTFFNEKPELDLQIPASRSEPGPEVALCVEPPTERERESWPIHLTLEQPLATTGAVSNRHGCLRVSAKDGPVSVKTPFAFPRQIDSVSGVVREGSSVWLGFVRSRSPALISILAPSGVGEKYSVKVVSIDDHIVSEFKLVGTEGQARAIRPGVWTVLVRGEGAIDNSFEGEAEFVEGRDTQIVLPINDVEIHGIALQNSDPIRQGRLRFVKAGTPEQIAVTHTSNEGEFEVELSAGHWHVSQVLKQLEWTRGAIEFDVLSGPVENLQLQFGGRRLTGTLIRSDTGDPVQGMVELSWRSDDQTQMLATRTDETGAFEFEALYPGSVTLRVDKPSLIRQRLRQPAPRLVNLRDGDSDVTIELSPLGGLATLHVVSAAGTPVQDAKIFKSDGGPNLEFLGRTDADGRAAVHLRDAETFFVVSKSHSWSRTTYESRENEMLIRLSDTATQVRELHLYAYAGFERCSGFWGLRDSDGWITPLAYHLLENGLSPVLAKVVPLPFVESGSYRVWCRGIDDRLLELGPVVLP